jgi:hypothetical protein
MISTETAEKLRDAGLPWEPANGDRFAVPERGLDDQVFLINDIAAIVESIKGMPAVTFHGTPEWALDYLWLGETIWLPSEEQVRTALEQHLMESGDASYDLHYAESEYVCRFEWRGEELTFRALDAAEAYAAALLFILSAQG